MPMTWRANAHARGLLPSACGDWLVSAGLLRMDLVYRYLLSAMWLSWIAYWWALSRNVKPAARRESVPSRLLHLVPLFLVALLLSLPHFPVALLGERFLPPAPWTFWTGAMLTLGGLVFTVWARGYLGRNWSGIVTVKEQHELITGGPYRIVRHPIYTGLLLAFIGSAVAQGEWRGVLAVTLALWAFWRKLRVEERWMRDQFPGTYPTYCQRVPALIPFVL
jgi:protein-S-isoprenylcysteine O-methyltransferase Ste14